MSNTPTDAAAKADALTNADAAALQPMADGHNSMQARADAVAKFEDMGRRAAEGAGSLTDAAFALAVAVANKVLSVGSDGGDDAEHVYLAYANAFNKRAGDLARGVDALPSDKDSAKSPISIFRTFGFAAPMAAQGKESSEDRETAVLEFYGRVLTAHGCLDKAERKSAYNAMVKINRDLAKEYKAAKVKDAGALVGLVATDDWILERCRKQSGPAKDLAAKVAELLGKLDKHAESGECPQLKGHVVRLNQWFKDWTDGKLDNVVELLRTAA